ncbi:MAG TPA: FAD-dependent oxidoreductase, partial [Kofleriaceae bacterium]
MTAVIGSGAAGLAASRALIAAGHEVTLYEAGPAPGGHVLTVDADGHAIDLGFIVCNRARYPSMFRMLDELGVATRPTAMSFSVALPGAGGEWASHAALAGRWLDRAHWRFLAEVVGFVRRARRELDAPSAIWRASSLDDYLARTRTPQDVRDGFVIPLAAALWSLAPDRCGAFPAETYLRFLDQHGMLRPIRPFAWRTIVGGSRRYVDALLAELRGSGRFRLELATPVTAIARDARGVTVVARSREHRHDRIVVATHADTALGLLDQPSDAERQVLGAFRYSENRTVLHTDRRFLPRSPAAHAAWNYVGDPDGSRVAVTYSMTRLQGLPDAPYLVTLNPRHRPEG